MRKVMVLLFVLCSVSFAAVPYAESSGDFVRPRSRDRCPVCGMFVAKYPDWIAEIVFTDGTYAVFDGAKDLFKYYFDMKTYGSGKDRKNIKAIIVTDYYSVQPANGRDAFFVLGSDVYGPMGKELVPFAREGDAREFMKDHHGKRLLTFDEITPSIIAGLEQ